MKIILTLAGMHTSKIVAFGAWKTRTHGLKSRCTKTSHCLVFFENEQGKDVTVNGDRFRAMLDEFLFTKIEEEDRFRAMLDEFLFTKIEEEDIGTLLF